MTQNIDRAVRGLFETEGRQTRNIKYFFQQGENSGDQLADYRQRAIHQIANGLSVEDVDLDTSILD